MPARLAFAFVLVALLAMLGCTKNRSPTQVSKDASGYTKPTTPAGPDIFTDMTANSGINFTFKNGEEADEYTILETLGGGVGLIDYDQDGKLDIFVTGGGHFKDKQVFGHPCKLYRNEGNWKFRDVTAEVGLDKVLHYSHGVAVGDFDNDGWPDLLVTGYGRMTLYRNNHGKFEEVTEKAGLIDKRSPHWSTSAAWADFNGDGFLDLYICHYVDWSFQNHPLCPGYRVGQPRDTCSPRQFKGLVHALYLNNGDGTFRDATEEAGLKAGKGLGVVVADFNDDGKPDIYVANDTTDNFLYLNQTPWPAQSGQLAPRVDSDKKQLAERVAHNVKFEEVGIGRGVATGENGKPNGSMGVDTADFDGSGFLSLFVTNFQGEMHDLYRNGGKGQFNHASVMSGISVIGQDYVGWGGGFLDFDNDGAEDLLICNGHVARFPPPPATLAQRPVLFRNLHRPGDRAIAARFTAMTQSGGPYFRTEHRARGVALGDLDNDGKIDLVISHVNEPVTILRNRLENGSHWLGVQLVGKPNADAIGARLTLEVGNRKLVRTVKGGASYLSSSDRRVVFGLGSAANVGKLTVRWPSGQTQTWDGLAVDWHWKLTEGEKEAK
jgi:enediyne biosynthesis protein E4